MMAALCLWNRRVVRGEDAEVYFQRGLVYSQKKDYDLAIDNYSQAIRRNPKNPSLYYNRGVAHSKKGNYAQAIVDYTEAIRLNPKDADAVFNRAFAYKRKGEYDKAIADYTQVAQLNPKDVTAYFNRAFAHEAKGDDDKAIADYTKSIQLSPRYFNAYLDRGIIHSKKKEFSRAIADYNAAIKINPKNGEVWGRLGWCQFCVGKYADAVNNSRKALELDDKLTWARLNLGLIYATQDDGSAAKKEYQKGLAKATPEEVRSSLQDVQDALKKQPYSASLRQALGMLQRR
jgi:tetratricopeptide (TPR) repeat protein